MPFQASRFFCRPAYGRPASRRQLDSPVIIKLNFFPPVYIFRSMTFRFWIPIIAIILVAVAYLAYDRTTPRVLGRRRWVLTALRTAAFLCLILIFFDPRCVRTVDQQEQAKVIVLVDRSTSMGLPSGAWDDPDTPTRFDSATNLSGALGSSVIDAGGELETVYFANGLSKASVDSVGPDGQGTDIVRSLQDVLWRHEGEHIAAIVLFSDGVETEERLVRPPLPGIPVFTVGFGDTTPPEDVRIKDVDYSSVVRVPSRSSIRATVSYTGSREKRAVLELTERGRVIFEQELTLSPAKNEITQEIPVNYRETGRREFTLSVDVDGYDAEKDNNSRDIVVEAKKAKAKILIVDLKPQWELHFLTDLLRRDQGYDFEVFSLPERQTTTVDKIKDPESFVSSLGECDAVILASVDESFFTGEIVGGLKRFVRERGGGLLVLPGNESLFERPRAWSRLGDILPIRGTPPFRWDLQYTSVLPGAQSASNPITTHLLPLLSQTDWQERSPLLGYYAGLSPTNVGEVLLNVKGRGVPAITYQTLGKGRVAVVSAGPLWRWKFLSDNNSVYDEIMSRMMDVLSRGEETDRFVVSVKKNVFDAGERPVVFAELFNEKMQPVTNAPVSLEVSRIDNGGEETPLEQLSMRRDAAENTRFTAVVPPLPPGRYLVRGQADLPDRTITSKAHEIQISKTSVEYRRVHQDRAALLGIALRTGGRYAPSTVDDLVRYIDLEPRQTQSMSEVTLRTSLLLFLLILVLLSAEWIIRKRSGMI